MTMIEQIASNSPRELLNSRISLRSNIFTRQSPLVAPAFRVDVDGDDFA